MLQGARCALRPSRMARTTPCGRDIIFVSSSTGPRRHLQAWRRSVHGNEARHLARTRGCQSPGRAACWHQGARVHHAVVDVEALVARGWRATSAGCAGRRRRLSPCSGAWCSGDPHNELRAEHLWTGALACRARPGSARCPGSARRLVQAPPGRAPMITSGLMVLTCLAARSFFRAKLLHQKHWCSDHREAWTYFRAGAHIMNFC